MAQETISTNIICTQKTVSLEEGRQAFYQLREEARKKNLQNMILDEINAEIAAVRTRK